MRLLIGLMMANNASGTSTQYSMMASNVSCQAADRRSLQAAGRLYGRSTHARCQRQNQSSRYQD
jgi:hypothetical protein